MPCTSPRTVGFLEDGKTLCWSKNKYSKEFATFQLPCGKCLSCRLDYSRQWAIRCVHEAKMHENNCFVTFTYDEKSLPKDGKLDYSHFQQFAQKLRDKIFWDYLKKSGVSNYWHSLTEGQKKVFRKEHKNEFNKYRVSYFATGEYGDTTKRPHWHALLFNYRPADQRYKYTSDRGDRVFESEDLKQLWPHGISEFGEVTYDSAAYCARYAAKKLSHGMDGSHPYEPISKKSSLNAIGKTWLESYWPDAFQNGYIVLPDGSTCSIPRYYEKWLKKNQPLAWFQYVTQVKQQQISKAQHEEFKRLKKEFEENWVRSVRMGLDYTPVISRNKATAIILEKRFKQLKEFLKL